MKKRLSHAEAEELYYEVIWDNLCMDLFNLCLIPVECYVLLLGWL
jgi:hypothetical protein